MTGFQESGLGAVRNPVSPVRVLVISHDVVGAQMAGPGIRYTHLARVLAQEFQVTLAVPGECTLPSLPGFGVFSYGSAQDPAIEKAIQEAGVVVAPAVWVASVPSLLRSSVPLVVDGYDPYLAETLFLNQNQVSHLQHALGRAYLAGDFFICASERQRDWWLGLLEAHGRINVHTFEQDASMRCLIDVVPFGMPEGRPRPCRPVFKEKWPFIRARDRVVLWGGGLWPWLDPLTAVRAVAQVWSERRDVRLVFPGTHHPNPDMSRASTWVEAARELAGELGLVDQAVFFGDWVPYSDWPGVLLESDVALSLHFDTLETRLAFRTRILDYIWAGLPMVVTRGDEMSGLVKENELGVVVDYQDPHAVAEAILKLLELPRESFQERFERVRQGLTWEEAARPLIEFCRHPRRAPDKVALGPGKGDVLLPSEVARLRELVAGYERGRFIRFTRCLHRWRRKIWKGS